MILRDELTTFIYDTLGRELLETAVQVDVFANNVQIKGKPQVNKVVLGVSASPEFIEQAVQENADYLIVHHGLHTGNLLNGRFDFLQHRLRLIFKQDLTLAGFHFALDAHPVLGNNAQIIEQLDAKRLEEPYFENWGWIGEFKQPVEVEKLAQQVSQLMEHDVYAVYAGPKKIKRIGVCSGGAVPRDRELFEILDHHIDLHLTGEIRESAPYMAEEGSFNYFACGHYATEVFGVKALAGAIKKHFGDKVEVEFLDTPSNL